MVKLIGTENLDYLESEINEFIAINSTIDCKVEIITTAMQYTVGNVSGHGLDTRLFHLAVINY